MVNIIAIVLGLLPGFAWLLFYLREDPNPEPKRLIALAYVNGAAFAFLALGVQLISQSVLVRYGIPILGTVAFILFAIIEEVLKFAAAYTAIHRRPEFDEPIDAMIYMVTAALGFATVENIGVVAAPTGDTLLLANVFQLITFRFVGATLLHALTSGIVGYHWAHGIARFGRAGWHLAGGILVASILHAIFNLIIFYKGDVLFAVLLLMGIGFFVLADFEKLKRKVV